jgi:prephenate dehydrogenase
MTERVAQEAVERMGVKKESGEGSKTRVFVIGLGLIGGSLARALRARAREPLRLSAFDIDSSATRTALEHGVIDEVAPISEGAARADLVVIATPIGTIADVFRALADAVSRDTVVTDTASIKEDIVAMAERILPWPENFIGGHPMAGSERGGFASSRPDLFVNRPYFLTPTATTSPDAFKKANWLVRTVGGRALAVDPREHDEIVAFNSHLPHLIAWALVKAATERHAFEGVASLSGGSFRDATRVALSSPSLWRDILGRNARNLKVAAEGFMAELKSLLELIERDPDAFVGEVARARDVRRAMTEPEGLAAAEAYEVEVIIANKPGELARVTTILGQAQVNIENLEIVHGVGQGVLMIEVAGEEAAQAAVAALRRAGYEASYEQSGGES